MKNNKCFPNPKDATKLPDVDLINVMSKGGDPKKIAQQVWFDLLERKKNYEKNSKIRNHA